MVSGFGCAETGESGELRVVSDFGCAKTGEPRKKIAGGDFQLLIFEVGIWISKGFHLIQKNYCQKLSTQIILYKFYAHALKMQLNKKVTNLGALSEN